ncbi:hypothetical protein BDV96DRAFT_562838 [Lophiotrema nucula]|uniref:Uncharacterized protein n=1 Tax=Lophiotrema nucula TaxID=690887 RepID=A0A6A5ZQU4_9PLEO|nr:hypothetical protein BDV96DRAFT_562838 [Lophiotrema nucula]
MDSTPRITVSISNSSDTFDLSTNVPFTIFIALKLDHSCPITFDKRCAGLFDGRLLHKGGLTFVNTSTGQPVPRSIIDLCYSSSNSDGTPTENDKETFRTLFPGKEYLIEANFYPLLSLPLFDDRGMTGEELAQKQDTLPRTWKWPRVGLFEDGETYEVGVSKKAVVGRWMEGSLEDLLAMKRSWLFGLVKSAQKPEIKGTKIEYTIEKTTKFIFKRPDKDGSLNWP